MAHPAEIRINPRRDETFPLSHFQFLLLYNTLQTISGIAIENNVLEIEEINNALSGILRYSLNNSKSIVKVSEEVRIVRDYMDIQKYRFGDKISLEIKLSDKALDMLVPVFTLQLPVENAIKHGMEKTTKAVHICIYDIIKKIYTQGHFVTQALRAGSQQS